MKNRNNQLNKQEINSEDVRWGCIINQDMGRINLPVYEIQWDIMGYTNMAMENIPLKDIELAIYRYVSQ